MGSTSSPSRRWSPSHHLLQAAFHQGGDGGTVVLPHQQPVDAPFHQADVLGQHIPHPCLEQIQCGIATLLSLKVYQYIRSLEPDREAALKAVAGFSAEDWDQSLRDFYRGCPWSW